MITYIRGNIFSHAVPNTVLAHACNPFGIWAGGIALRFREHFPTAYDEYAGFCFENSDNPTALLGTCLLIPVGEVHIACLFTGDFECSKDKILEYTEKSVSHLARQLAMPKSGSESDSVSDSSMDLGPGPEPTQLPVISMPLINSGIFNVPWEKTEAVLSRCPLHFKVYTK